MLHIICYIPIFSLICRPKLKFVKSPFINYFCTMDVLKRTEEKESFALLEQKKSKKIRILHW